MAVAYKTITVDIGTITRVRASRYRYAAQAHNVLCAYAVGGETEVTMLMAAAEEETQCVR